MRRNCLRGWLGSGTIFLGRCNLRCVFCQNWDISQHRRGSECTADELASLMLELQDQGCHNVNLVTPEHVAPQVVEAVAIAEMHHQVGALRFDRRGLARRGVLVRHLVMPGQRDETAAIFEWLAREVSVDTYVNVMDQHRPAHRVGVPSRRDEQPFAEIDRRPYGDEIEAARDAARRAGPGRLDERRPLRVPFEVAG